VYANVEKPLTAVELWVLAGLCADAAANKVDTGLSSEEWRLLERRLVYRAQAAEQGRQVP
jgi:hypothetical protein